MIDSRFHFARKVKAGPVSLSQERLKQAYNELHARQAFRAPGGYYEWLLRLLKPEDGQQLLDVGCGSGGMLKAAAAQGLRVAGIDISETAIAQARVKVPDADVRVASAQELPFPDASFDLVTCVGSLEHVLEPDQGLREMRRVARPAGQILLIVPNSEYLFAWVSYLRQTFFRDHGQPVERLARREEWQELIAASGLRIVALHKDNHVYFPGRVLQALARISGSMIPLRFCYQLVFLARKVGSRQ